MAIKGPPGLVSLMGQTGLKSNGGELVSPQVGKRRGGRILATGMVKKQRKEPQDQKVCVCTSDVLIVITHIYVPLYRL